MPGQARRSRRHRPVAVRRRYWCPGMLADDAVWRASEPSMATRRRRRLAIATGMDEHPICRGPYQHRRPRRTMARTTIRSRRTQCQSAGRWSGRSPDRRWVTSRDRAGGPRRLMDRARDRLWRWSGCASSSTKRPGPPTTASRPPSGDQGGEPGAPPVRGVPSFRAAERSMVHQPIRVDDHDATGWR
jgi:hypothetical protein